MARVLVVDDDPDVLTLVAHHLARRGGHRVLPASSAAEALAALDERDTAPDVAVLDVLLPGMTGLELAEELRRRRGAGALPVVFLSARTGPDDIAAGRAAGAIYLTKPFVATALLAAVERALADAVPAAPAGW